MKKISLFVLVVMMTASAWAHLPLVKKIGYPGVGFYPLCSHYNSQERTYNIPENTSKLFLTQYMGYSWGNALPLQYVNAVLTSTVRKYPTEDQPALGIYEHTLGELGFFEHQHQYIHYILLDLQLEKQTIPCWLQITDIEYHSDTCDVTGR